MMSAPSRSPCFASHGAARLQEGVRPEGHDHSSAGFTLVELLIAFALLGLLALMALGALQFGTRVWDRTAEDAGANGSVRAVQNLIRQQLGRVIAKRQFEGGVVETVTLRGTPDMIEFVAPLPFGRDTGGLYLQQLMLAEAASGKSFGLTWRELRSEEGEGSAFGASDIGTATLLPGVAGLRYTYLAPGRGRTEPAWRETWDEKSLPLLIRLNIEFVATAPHEWPELVIAPRPILTVRREPE